MLDLDKDLDEILSLDKDPKFYKEKYNELIQTAKAKRPTLNKSDYSEYLEKHHILPRCMGGKDEDSNFVLLSYKEHVVAHCLLFLGDQNNVSLSLAANLMLDPSTFRLEKSSYSDKTISEFLDNLSIIREEAILSISKSVVCIDFYTKEVLKIFPSVSSLSNYGFHPSAVSEVALGVKYRKTAGGYKWMYLDDYIKIYPDNIEKYYKNINNGWIPPYITKKEKIENLSRQIQIVGYSNDLSVIKTYKKISDVEQDGFSKSNVGDCVRLKRKKHFGINWKLRSNFIKKYPNYSDKNPEKIKILSDNRILLVDNSNNILKIYDSVHQIVKEEKLCDDTIRKAINENKLAFGYYWYKACDFPDKQKIKAFDPNLIKIKPIFSKEGKEPIIKYIIKNKNVNIIDIGSILSRGNNIYKCPLWNAISSNSLYQGHYWLYYEDFKKKYPKELEEYEERIKNNSEDKGEIH